MRRKRLSLIIALLILALLMGCLGWTVYAPVRQEKLNRALIAAIQNDDKKTALSLLIEGANPNAQDLPPPHLSLWKLLWDRLRGKRPGPAKAPPALLLAVQDNVLIYSMHEGLIGYRPHEDTTLIQALLTYGADVSARNEQGETALHIAEDHPQVVALLKQAGAKE